VDAAHFQQALDGYHPANGRLQRFRVGGREVVLNLAKNPTGFNQNLSLLLADERPKAAFFVVNDNYNDGRDISWIWDVDFERLSDAAAAGELMVMVGGARAAELRVRLKYAEVCKSAPMVQTMQETLGRLSAQPRDIPLYVLCNYSALWPAKAELEKLGDVV
jgi:UDP-N-acetylmuramyl tripeptide synthase